MIQAIEELNKDLRQCNLQQFIQQTGVPLSHGNIPLSHGDIPVSEQVNTELHLQGDTAVSEQYLSDQYLSEQYLSNQYLTDQYLCNAGILEEDLPGSVSAMC